MNGKSIRRLNSRGLVLGTVAFCALYLCQVIPHAHAVDDLAPQPEAVQPNHHPHHSHSSDDHHHHDHDPAPQDDRSHHHHALSWHVDLHFGRLLGENLNLAVEDGPLVLPAPISIPENTALTTWHARDVEPGQPIPIAPLEARGPPTTA